MAYYHDGEHFFIAFLNEHYDKLLKLPAGRLTFVAESLGKDNVSEVAVPMLKKLLNHPRPIVREGAVLGLAYHIKELDVQLVLGKIVDNDPSPGVRETAQDILDSELNF